MTTSENVSSSCGDGDVLFHDDAEITYTHCYCEENVWHLCNTVREKYRDQLDHCFCVFISNQEKAIPLWCQKSSEREDGCVLWDYHVIFIQQTNKGSFVYDLDTKLEFPCTFKKYVTEAIRSCHFLKPNFTRRFRVIDGAEFLSVFASDRSHMLNEKNEWLKPPPSYACIHTQESTNNLQEFINMEPGVGVGKVVNYTGLCDMFLTQDNT